MDSRGLATKVASTRGEGPESGATHPGRVTTKLAYSSLVEWKNRVSPEPNQLMENIMKKILIAAAASTALFSSAAFAQSNTDDADLDVTATVNQECSIANPTPVVFAEVNINEGAGSNALLLQNGSQSSSQNIWVSCNYPTSITTQSANDGLLNDDPNSLAIAQNDSSDFTNKIEYRVLLTSTDSSFPNLDYRTRLEASESVTAAGAFHNDASLRVVIDRDDTQKRPVSGTYTDTTTITLGVV